MNIIISKTLSGMLFILVLAIACCIPPTLILLAIEWNWLFIAYGVILFLVLSYFLGNKISNEEAYL